MKDQGGGEEVRFELFGRFRIYVDDEEVDTQDTTFYTYLKLLLLSGQTYLDSSSSCPLWASPRAVRETVDRGNSRRRAFQGGRFDFTADTGVSLKYRDGLGLHFQGASPRSDLQEFEEVWGRLKKASNDELLGALSLYGKGVDILSWKKDLILINCSNWIENRLAVLNAYRDDIQTELDRRLDSRELARTEPTATTLDEPPEGWSEEEGIPHVISGLGNGSTEVESDEIVSPVLRDPLCRLDEPHEQVYESVIDEPSSGDEFQPQSGSGSDVTQTAPVDSNDPLPEVESGMANPQPTGYGRGLEPSRRRNVTALGVVVSAVLLAIVFAAGYVIGYVPSATSQPDDQRSPQSNLGSKPEIDTSGGVTLPKDDPAEEQPIVRAPENPISLHKLFLRNIGEGGFQYVEEDVVVGRQLFAHYLFGTTGSWETIPAYKLDGQFKKVTCIVGVDDAHENAFSSATRQVLFEGDGKVLKRLEVEPGQAVQVSLQVTDIKVLMISFRFPVVIASPKAHR